MASRLQPYPRRLPSPWHRPLDVDGLCSVWLFLPPVRLLRRPPSALHAALFWPFSNGGPSHLSMLASLAHMESARSFQADQS